MADISSITLPGGGTYNLKDKNAVPRYGMGKNLLRNWYFVGGGTDRGVFPVNQRGQSSYANIGYSIDNWYIRNTFASVELIANGLKLKKNTANYGDLGQYLAQETLSILSGKTVTLSWLDDIDCKSVTFIWTSNANPVLVYSIDGLNIYAGVNSSNVYNLLFQTTAAEKVFKAVKLELGTEQTLCHNEGTVEAPVWVLNEIPDYEYELYRCMTSTADPSDTYANKSLATRQDLTNIQATGTTNNTGAVISAGAYFYLNGILYQAKQQINPNATFTVNTNCEQVPEGGLNRLNEPIKINRQVLATSVSTGLNILTAAPTAISGYKAIGVAGVQFASTDRSKLNLVEFLLDSGQTVTVVFNSTYTRASGCAVAAFVIYAKE